MKTKTVLLLLLAVITVGAQVRDPLPVPDIPGYKTLKADLHIHTVFSDGNVWPAMRLQEAWREGLDVIAITDHINYTPHKDDVAPDSSRPYQMLRDTAAQTGIIVIPGAEYNGPNSTHFNLLFLKDANDLKGLEPIPLLKRAREHGAFIVWNHPGWKQTPEWFPLIKEAHDAKLLDGMEIVNGRTFFPEAYPWIEEKSLTAFANTDVHGVTAYDYPNRTRPLTLIFAKTADEAGVREALEARRTAPWMGGEVWGREAELRGLWSGAVTFEPAELTARAGRGSGFRVYNRSAIPFRFRMVSGPEWLTVSGRLLEPEKITAVPVAVAKNAPAGMQRVQVQLEITNIHTAPGKNLVVTVPIAIGISE